MKRCIKGNGASQTNQNSEVARFFQILSEEIPDHEKRLAILFSMIRSFAFSADSEIVDKLCEQIWPTITAKRTLPYGYKSCSIVSLAKEKDGYPIYLSLLNEYLESLEVVVKIMSRTDTDISIIDSVKEEMLAICHVAEAPHTAHRVMLNFFTEVEELGNKGMTMTHSTQIFHKSLSDLPPSYLHKHGISAERIWMYAKYLLERRRINSTSESAPYLDSMIRNLGVTRIQQCSFDQVIHAIQGM